MMFDTKIPAIEFAAKCEEKGLRLIPFGPNRIRVVTHMDVSFEDMNDAVKIISGIV
jgi:hypothetical protein